MLLPSVDEVQRAVGDRYQILDLAGAGGMGAVFRARHLALGHIVAIKVLPPEVATSEMRRRRFQREASLTAQLSHPNIVPVYEFDSRDGITFLIMPFVRGVPLSSVLEQRQRLALSEALRIVREVGTALEFAHRRGIVHRDVKPSNILIEEDSGRVLLTDFGVARARGPGDSSLTAPGTAVGTPDYMAPEQLAGDEGVDGRADVYALGLVAFEALTGTLPLVRTARPLLAHALSAAQPRCSAPLAEALVAPLAERPGDRPSTAGAWLEQLARAERRGRRRRLQVAAAFAVALTGLVLAVRSRPGGPPAPALAVMPFDVLGGRIGARDLTVSFARRLSAAPNITVLSGTQVWTEATRRFGTGPLTLPQADSLAAALGADRFIQPRAVFTDSRVRLSVALHRRGRGSAEIDTTVDAHVDSLDQVMATAGAHVLRAELGRGGTLPPGYENTVDYLNADFAFRRAEYELARTLYNRVIAHVPDFAPAYFRRLLVEAQAAPSEQRLVQAVAGATGRRAGLLPSDSLLLDGYAVLLERGDGSRALQLFQEARDAAPGEPHVRFVLGAFHFYFQPLFGTQVDSARAEFAAVLGLEPRFAPAIANLIALAHQAGDDREARRLIQLYQTIDSTSVVAELVGIVDTALFGSLAEARRLLNRSLERRPFTVLLYLAFQAAQFATAADSALATLATRRVLRAMERRAADEDERALALRWAVAADLAARWPDSARARLARATPGSASRERDRWIVLARVEGLDSLGDPRAAAERLGTESVDEWLRARLSPDPTRGPGAAALDAVARRDSAPLPTSLALDLRARAALARGDTGLALGLWDTATQRYAVFSAAFDVVASLWPLRRELSRVASAARDTTRAVNACATFDALIGYVDQVVRREMDQVCGEWRRLRD
jgi:tetratricopeptide (TPR) repeat protein